MKRPGERVADTSGEFWAKSNAMEKNSKSHLWHKSPSQNSISRSHCGRLAYGVVLRAADKHTERCKTCEKKAVAV